MRKKVEILLEVRKNINKAPIETRPMLEHEYCFVEIMLDIRDLFQGMFNRLADISEALQDKD